MRMVLKASVLETIFASIYFDDGPISGHRSSARYHNNNNKIFVTAVISHMHAPGLVSCSVGRNFYQL
jgi:hypothetical protein